MLSIMDSAGDDGNLHWTTIVITCSSASVREGVEEECNRLSKGGLLPSHDLLLVLDDPRPEGHLVKHESEFQPGPGVGSGGATINALLVTIERLSAQQGHTTISSELVHSSRILVVHHGRLLVHSPGGTAFLRLSPEQTFVPPCAKISPPTLLQHTIWMTTKISANSKTGVWVTSLDAFLPYSSLLCPPHTDGVDGAIVCTVAAPLQHAAHHGVVIAANGQDISKMEYRMPLEEMRKVFPEGIGTVISGVVFLSGSLTEQLLGLHTVPPLDRCTYYGMDSGVPPLQVSLYFDLLLPLCHGVAYNEYITGQCGAVYAQASSYNGFAQQESRAARLQIWKQLQGHKACYHLLEGTRHHYLGSNLPFELSIMPLLPSTSIVHTDNINAAASNEQVVTVNSFIQGEVKSLHEKIHILDSWVGKNVSITSKGPCVFLGMQLQESSIVINSPSGHVWQMYPGEKDDVVTCHGFSDDLSRVQHDGKITIFNTEWATFLARTGLNKDDLWPDVKSHNQTALTAKLFVLNCSIEEQIQIIVTLIGAITDDETQLKWMSKIEGWKSCSRVSLLEAASRCSLKKIMKEREDIYLETVKQFIEETADDVGGKSLLQYFNYLVTSKDIFLANMVYSFLALQGSIIYVCAFEAGNQRVALDHMTKVCTHWIKSGRPEDLIRAARHFERASQIVISKQVETADIHVSAMWVLPELCLRQNVGVWVEAHSPARIDLAGGWSDTPPICYEQGGAVLNIAIKINKKKPIGARVRITSEFHIVCTLRDWSGGDVRLTWTTLDDLRDYDNPVAPGALVKATLLYCKVVDLTSEDSLAVQLKDRYDGGLEVEVWSHLPQGSGLGGSSLLAGALVSAIIVLLGHPPPRHSHLIHATLCIEQWLTTGGGWQDQVGGLVGGAKLGVSRKGTPVTVSTYKIPLSQTFIDRLNEHLLLLYTGKIHYFNFKCSILYNYYSIFNNKILYYSLTNTPNNKKIKQGIYFQVSKLMATLHNHCLGMSLAGAGGGGYLYALKARPGPLEDSVDLGGLTSDCVEVDQQGLELWVGGETVTQVNEDDVLTHEKWLTLLEMIQVP
nr:L-fucose kinase-like [Procambarus clarkii]